MRMIEVESRHERALPGFLFVSRLASVMAVDLPCRPTHRPAAAPLWLC